MLTLSKVGLDVCSHFQKWDWMYAHRSESGIGCMFTLPKVASDVCSLSKNGIRCMFQLSKVGLGACSHFQK